MKIIEKELSYKLIGVIYEVFNQIGGGHKEKMYQKAISIKLKEHQIKFEEQVATPVKINDEQIGIYFLDFVVEDKIIIEIKQGKHFKISDFRQTKSYLSTTGHKLALLIVFTLEDVRFRRILNLY
jgi:GxxExxY protein